jgi:O-antigen ligase
VSKELVSSFVGQGVAAEREKSLAFRLECEDKFLAVVSKQPIIGMGADPKARPVDEDDRPVVSDALWIIQFFDTGYVGLAALLAFFLWPAWRFVRRVSPAEWRQPTLAPAAICATILVLTMCDFCVNGLINPVYILVAAALTGWNQSMVKAGALP